MEEKKSLVEEAIIQMKNLEEVIAENAKGILASTMKEEISELVKESLNETKKSETHEDEEEEEDFAMTADDEESEEEEESDEEEFEDEGEEEEMDITMMDIEDEPMMSDIPSDDETIDLTGESDDTVLSVLKKMKPEDQIIVKKENGHIHLKDDKDGVEYMISMTESEEDEELDEMWQTSTTDESMDEMTDEGMYSETYEDTDEGMYAETYEDMEEDMDEVVYEITMDDEDEDEEEEEEEFEEEYEEGYSNEDYKPMKESKMTIKPKGMGMGHASKAKYPKSLKHGTTEAKEGMVKKGEHKEGKMTTKPVGTGIGKGPKFTYEEGEHMDSTKGMKDVKFSKKETKEAARTLGNGKRWGKPGLPKPKAAPRHLNLESEVRSLRDKNEEYRKALNIFREKLNEVAVFNANLAYATRLFTEHSTTKQEKINILRRFDSVDSLKESKALYKTLKEEFSSSEGKVVKESIENVIDRNPQSGSAVNLIENKTYENPQFMRMKDLMSKLIK